MRRPTAFAGLMVSAALAASLAGLATGAAKPGTKANPIKATTSFSKGFAPKTTTVKPGVPVYFKNVDRARHNAVAKASGGKPGFRSGSPTTKDFSVKAPAKVGRYAYACTVHAFMKGVLMVKR